MDYITEDPVWHPVMDEVLHHDAAIAFFQEMLVMPKCIGAAPLLIDEIVRALGVRDLGGPFDGNTEKGTNTIFDDQTRVCLFRDLALYLKAHTFRRDTAQIPGPG